MPGVTTPGWNIVQPHPGKDPRGDSESVPGPLTSLISTDSSFYGSTNAPDILRRTTTYQAGTGTLTSSILILIYSVFGSSILVVPFAFSQCGWALCTLCMIFCCLFTELGAHFLLESARLVTSMYPSVNSDALSFADIASHATPRLAFLPTVLVIVTCLGSAVSALVVAGDILPATLQDLALLFHHTSWVEDSDGKVDSYLLNRPTWVTLPLVCVLPLCFLHSITSLQYVGIITCIAVVYFIVLVFVLFLFPSAGACLLYPTSSSRTCAENVVAYPASVSSLVHSFLLACPIFFVSFSIIYQVLPVHNALRYPSLTTTRRATAGALVFSGLTYLLVSVSAYLTFGDRVQGNLFKNYGNTGALAVSRVMMLAVVALLFPLVST